MTTTHKYQVQDYFGNLCLFRVAGDGRAFPMVGVRDVEHAREVARVDAETIARKSRSTPIVEVEEVS